MNNNEENKKMESIDITPKQDNTPLGTKPNFTANIPFDIDSSLNYKKQNTNDTTISENLVELSTLEIPETPEILGNSENLNTAHQSVQPYSNLPYQSKENSANQYISGNYNPNIPPPAPNYNQSPYPRQNPYMNMQQTQYQANPYASMRQNPYFSNAPKEKDRNLISVISLILSLSYSLSFGFFLPFLLMESKNKPFLLSIFTVITITFIALPIAGIIKHKANNGKSKAALLIMVIGTFIATLLMFSLNMFY